MSIRNRQFPRIVSLLFPLFLFVLPPGSHAADIVTRAETKTASNSDADKKSDADAPSVTTTTTTQRNNESRESHESRRKSKSQGRGFSYYTTSKDGYSMERGSGRLSTEKRTLEPFTGIVLEGGINIDVTVGPATSAEVEIDDNLQEHIILEVVDGNLLISSKGSYSTRLISSIRITTPSLDYLRVDGSGNTDIDGLAAKEFTFELNGSGNLFMAGSTDMLEVDLNGSGNVDTRNCRAQEAYVSLSGSGNAKVTATKLIDARLSGSGEIDVYGKPSRIRKSEDGSGNITVH